MCSMNRVTLHSARGSSLIIIVSRGRATLGFRPNNTVSVSGCDVLRMGNQYLANNENFPLIGFIFPSPAAAPKLFILAVCK